MSDTVTITEDEIEAVAAKLDAGETLDEYDRVILRGVFLLAGRTTAEFAEAVDEVSGFAQPGPGSPGVNVGIHFTNNLCDGSVRGALGAGKAHLQDFHFTHVYDKSSPTL